MPAEGGPEFRPTSPVKGAGPARPLPGSRGARWAALGAAVVIVGGGVAVAVADHHDGGPARSRALGPGPVGPGEHRAAERPGARSAARRSRAKGAGERDDTGERGGAARQAPAPLPSLAIGAAADKAAGAVTGGTVESLRVIGQEGGGSAWLAVVVGPDGVRHRVTLSGADGAVTGNTTVPGR
ncbi:hypothetical protein GCM10010371_46920 [Streptomyces subrutilus]|uniref:PepSY domain-containing protein n=1 Tax=Streptomyces subrutilus TaxID=36818 RepID=A0A5P2UTT7_9ACTN|nr:hypothetical protein [Streptomyces subrutilus]QEU82533.1 hypothetical protein CP968_33585 [Streptomyces subrutilus]GGZ81893.1 hypothetical protein GCM10010371_46920 [Streptomyces subrutilus]